MFTNADFPAANIIYLVALVLTNAGTLNVHALQEETEVTAAPI
jgi:hypothetical protein